MSFDLPPIVKQAELVRAMAEAAVATWRREHRYAHGTELRRQAKNVVGLALDAWTLRDQRAEILAQLSRAVDLLKTDLRLAQHIKLYRSWGQFEEVMRAAQDLGKQCGALLKKHQQSSKGQNAPTSRAGAARPDTEYPGRLAEANA